MRRIFIGDAHGCLDELQQLVEKVEYRQGIDDLIALGDLLDKGPNGPGCVKFVRSIGGRSIKGNHEEKNLRWRKHELIRGQKANPVSLSPECQAQHLGLSEEDFAWLEAMPTHIAFGSHFVAVHAGMVPGVAVEKQLPRDLLRLRWVKDNKMVPLSSDMDPTVTPPGAHNWSEVWDGPQGVVYGHAVHSLSNPKIDRRGENSRNWCFGIDTGCVHGGRLTALVFEGAEMERHEIVQVPAKRSYAPMLAKPLTTL